MDIAPYSIEVKKLGERLHTIMNQEDHLEFLELIRSCNSYRVLDQAGRYCYEKYGVNPVNQLVTGSQGFSQFNTLTSALSDLYRRS